MRIVTLPSELRTACEEARRAGKRVGFVPTMGALHEGHLALVRAAGERADFVAASIFVNPTQFGPKEDFSRYPRDLDGDAAKLASAGCVLLFAPDTASMYPAGERTRVRVDFLTETLCGPFRPGHFEGVATIVTKLFALVGEADCVFGKKDYQQLAVLRRLAADLLLPVTIHGHPIVREIDGLAMSSRNAYLDSRERGRALCLVKGLRATYAAFASGERDGARLEAIARAEVEKEASSIDYVSVVDPATLHPFAGPIGDLTLCAIAGRVGMTRLIDNVVLGEGPASSLR